MIAIKRITLREIVLPLRERFQISSGFEDNRRILLLELENGDGTSVWSECVAGAGPNYSPEGIATAWVAIDEWVAPRVVGHEFRTPEEVSTALEQNIRGNFMARAAVEMGCWAVAAQQHGVSLATLLGGTREQVATGISIGIQSSPDVLVDKARAAREAGYRKIKAKIKPGADLEFIGAVRDALGMDLPLMADANNAYDLADAEHLAKLDDFGLLMIEQPLAWDDVIRHAELQRKLRTPICLDESITSVAKAQDMIDVGAGRIVNIKPGRVGGLTNAKAIHDLCERNSIPVWCGGMLESGVGRAYNVALASLPNFVLPGDISPSARYWERDVVSPEWTMTDGMVTVPRDTPGIGVSVDVDRVEDVTVRSQTLNTK